MVKGTGSQSRPTSLASVVHLGVARRDTDSMLRLSLVFQSVNLAPRHRNAWHVYRFGCALRRTQSTVAKASLCRIAALKREFTVQNLCATLLYAVGA